jgi:bifunctional non-homologous end joining protein LigD
LRWEELGRIESAAQFDIDTTVARLKRQRKDPWDGIDSVKQNLATVLKALASRK